jgi:hypothetical protein
MKHTTSNEPSPIWITGILLLLAVSIIGIMLYVKLIFAKTEPELTGKATTTDQETTTTASPSATASPATTADDDADLTSIDTDIKAYSSAAADIDTSLNDSQGDLSE